MEGPPRAGRGAAVGRGAGGGCLAKKRGRRVNVGLALRLLPPILSFRGGRIGKVLKLGRWQHKALEAEGLHPLVILDTVLSALQAVFPGISMPGDCYFCLVIDIPIQLDCLCFDVSKPAKYLGSPAGAVLVSLTIALIVCVAGKPLRGRASAQATA